MDRRTFLTGIGATFAFALLGGVAVETYRVVVERHVIEIDGLTRPARVVFAADVHFGPYVSERTVARWIDLALAENPDLVLLGGDIVDRWTGSDREPVLRQLARLEAPLGVFGVWGNHDHVAVDDLDAFSTDLRAAGVRVLVNEGTFPRDDLWLGGIDDLRAGRPNLQRTLSDRDATRASILLSHNPDVLPAVPVDVGLTLAGHTHGGQICLPTGRPIVTSSRFGRRFASGWVRGPARGYVSRGLGVSLVPARTFCPPELTVLDLRPVHA